MSLWDDLKSFEASGVIPEEWMQTNENWRLGLLLTTPKFGHIREETLESLLERESEVNLCRARAEFSVRLAAVKHAAELKQVETDEFFRDERIATIRRRMRECDDHQFDTIVWYKKQMEKVRTARKRLEERALNKRQPKAAVERRRICNTEATAAEIIERIALYGGRCAYCGGPYQELDHFVAISKGGSGKPENIVPACTPCNRRKRALTPSEWYMKMFGAEFWPPWAETFRTQWALLEPK